MTTTCRPLCVLLVFALCCCPCAFTTAVVSEKDGPDVPPTPLKEPTPGKIYSVSNIPKVSSQDIAGVSAQPVTAVAGGGSGALSTTQDKIEAPGHSLPGSGNNDLPRSTDIPDNTVEKNTEHNTEESKNNKKDRVQTPNTTTTTTTTTTQAPITTTSKEAPTTTTTTTTTKTPGDTATTTEVSTTTTTRAPSRLRESDGSLSSSAWVCAPLLLAVSALACTALG
ncbi:putative mucin TcMUCII [Trypanosoma cruzi]|nr:putative mucin TcMUCII [Trypanosoma cruzi]RNC41261.1 mucin TcMUCII [Trypanosoma cruzi]